MRRGGGWTAENTLFLVSLSKKCVCVGGGGEGGLNSPSPSPCAGSGRLHLILHCVVLSIQKTLLVR